ncbi:trans-sulfuration enzyme family protein [Flavobacterium columnare]|uniref:trans-sulfuration enzyme family protein n=1 Tax=Flavobacterium columnare TaxID=996 RepID=UPI001BC86F66|nr:PLP-dependent aspartate aminotransferase family protein [Flavobacterium columnare]
METVFAKVENGYGVVCTNTGIAAITLLFETVLQSGDRVLVERDCYEGTYRLLNILLEKNNIEVSYADFTNTEEVEDILAKNKVTLILCETPTNPLMKLADIKAVAVVIKKYSNILFAVDNTFATPYLQKPLDLGADIVMHSATKYLGGHSDVIAGALIVKEEALGNQLHFQQFATGATLGPNDSFLVLRGIKTLHLRVQRHCENGVKVAEFLVNHPKVEKVYYPGLENHPFHEVAKKQMKILPAVLTVDFEDEFIAESVIKNTQLFGEKVSFGTADSKIEIPAKMSHATYSEKDLQKIGLTKATVRFSIGLENTEDLVQDIQEAIDCASLKVY